MSDKLRLKLDLYDVKLLNFAAMRMIQNGEAIVQQSLLRHSTATKEEVDMLISDVKRFEKLREYLTAEIEKAGEETELPA